MGYALHLYPFRFDCLEKFLDVDSLMRTRTKLAVVEAHKFIAAARSFRDSLERLEAADSTESEELLGCTLLKVARMFDKGGSSKREGSIDPSLF